MSVGGGRIAVVARIRQMRPGGGRVYVNHALPKFGGPIKEAFDCFLLCGECGWLDTGAVRDAYREAPDADPGLGHPCPSCAASNWIDLNHIDTALALRESDEQHRLTPSGWARQRTLTLTGLVGVLTFAGLVLGAGMSAGPLLGGAALAAGLGAMAFYQLFKLPLAAWLHGQRDLYPTRWRLPLPVAEQESPVRDTVRGVVTSKGELLKAPLSGRPCVGYELAILFDADGDARPPMWVLEEEHTASFELGGRSLDADGATLEIPLEPVGPDAAALTPEDVALFLRKRGLFASDGRFEFFEALVEPGQTYELRYHQSPDDAAPVIWPG